jgi:hypothetical protein
MLSHLSRRCAVSAEDCDVGSLNFEEKARKSVQRIALRAALAFPTLRALVVAICFGIPVPYDQEDSQIIRSLVLDPTG